MFTSRPAPVPMGGRRDLLGRSMLESEGMIATCTGIPELALIDLAC